MKKTNSRSIVIRLAEMADTKQVAELHINVFPRLFLSSFGGRFIEGFYQHIMHLKETRLIIAEQGNQLAGFLAITIKDHNIYIDYIKSHFLFVCWSIIITILWHPSRSILVWNYFKEYILGFKSASVPLSPEEIIFIAVNSRHRREGIGRMLVQKLWKELDKNESIMCSVIVDVDNHQALRFYEQMGFKKELCFRQFTRKCWLMNCRRSVHRREI